jgi:hypothetical protein
MKSNFELGDEQPDRPMNTPTRRPYKPSGNFIFDSCFLLQRIEIITL